jgi:MFS family permease
MAPIVQTVIATQYDEKERGKRFGVLGMIGAMATLAVSTMTLVVSNQLVSALQFFDDIIFALITLRPLPNVQVLGVSGWKIVFLTVGVLCVITFGVAYNRKDTPITVYSRIPTESNTSERVALVGSSTARAGELCGIVKVHFNDCRAWFELMSCEFMRCSQVCVPSVCGMVGRND